MSDGRIKMLTLSDPQFHKRIIDRHSMGKRKYNGSPALVYKKVSRSLIAFKSRVCVTVPTIKLILTGIVPKLVPEISALKNRTDCIGDVSSSLLSPKILPLRISAVIEGTRVISAFKSMEAPAINSISSIFKGRGIFDINPFLQPPINRYAPHRGMRSSAERPKRSLIENAHHRGAHFQGNNCSLIPPFSLSELNTSGWLYPVHKYGRGTLDPAYPPGIGQYQNNTIYRNTPDISTSGLTNIPGADKELYLHSPSEMEHLITQDLMEIKRSMTVTRETVMAQSAAIYSQIQKDLKRQFNTEMISEKVYRQIEQRLKVEYERRGII